ncbi:MAG: glycerol-3-phosphate dehydrogenase [Candidatus Margulisbacteria bacterium]|nr:glycerol-3-phosphate dehydrogenase [Candidatus Margulisiibacteriota bacterium]
MLRPALSRVSVTIYDVIVLGGGINGVGIARELALRGHSVLLVEKGDIGGGTSSASSKLVHGGLRYLEQGAFGLVWEACRERYYLLKNAPHLVRKLAFLVPVYKTSSRPVWMVRVGVWLYDRLSGRHRLGDSCWISSEEAIRREPGILRSGLLGAAIYVDAQMDDARVCLETALQAQEFGATILNYTSVTGVSADKRRVESVQVRDVFSGEEATLKAKYFVNATGPWSDVVLGLLNPNTEKMLHPSKGVHIITRKLTQDHAVLVMSQSDGRMFFVLPWGDQSMIGTTDTDYKGPIDSVAVEPEDIEYLIREAGLEFPDSHLTPEDVVSSFAGIRPLLRQKKGVIGAVSREHKLSWNRRNFLSVMGGKFTTYRAVSEAVAAKVHAKLSHRSFRSLTRELPLFGGDQIEANYEEDSIMYSVSKDIYEYVISRYGSAYRDVLLTLTERSDNCEYLVGTTYLKGEVVYAIRYEFAMQPEDFMRRRTQLFFMKGQGASCAQEVSEIFVRECNEK